MPSEKPLKANPECSSFQYIPKYFRSLAFLCANIPLFRHSLTAGSKNLH